MSLISWLVVAAGFVAFAMTALAGYLKRDNERTMAKIMRKLEREETREELPRARGRR